VLDLTISLHGVYCFDTVFHVRARPMPRLAVDCGEVRWDPDSAPARYDLVRGDLETLRETGGDYQVATDECVASGVTAESIPYSVSPAPGGAYWFLQRTVGDSYDAYDTALAEPRDAGIDGSPVSCP